jgi:hypothetical protein
MGVAKGNSRKRHDRARAQALRAEDARRRADAKARRHFDAVFERATDPVLPPAGLAALILDELPGSIAAARIAPGARLHGTQRQQGHRGPGRHAQPDPVQ